MKKTYLWIAYGTDGAYETSAPEGVFPTALGARKAIDAKHGKRKWTKTSPSEWNRDGWYTVERFELGKHWLDL